MLALADVAVVVRDASASAEWWREKLGFAIHRIGDHAIMAAPPGDRFVLHRCEGFAPVEPGDTGIAFLSDELSALSARLRAKGVQFPEPYREGSGAASAKFADPDGNILLAALRSFPVRAEHPRAPCPTGAPARRAETVPPEDHRAKVFPAWAGEGTPPELTGQGRQAAAVPREGGGVPPGRTPVLRAADPAGMR